MKRVLVVEDKEDNLYYLVTLLGASGYEVESARHGAEALAKARRAPPDIVITDLLMPVMDGYTLLRHWKADDQLQQIPFVVYTATYTDPEDERLAKNLGADAFILKPMEPDDFLARLRSIDSVAPASVPQTTAHESVQLREYNETLIRKLEQKTLQLEETNRRLQADIAARELTEAALRRVEEQFRQAQKMEAVGRLAGGIAHDFNNLLSVILTYATVAVSELREDDPLREDMEEVRKAGERATELTRQLLAFSRQQMLRPRVLSLSATVIGVEKMLQRLIGEDIELVLATAPAGGRVYADPGQVEQIVMNLVVNARDAMPRGGKLTIQTADVELATAAEGSDRASVLPGGYVMLAVSDTGTGIDAPTRERIFEPFFTTKEMGKGTGLGLSTVFGIVKQSQGHIEVESEPGAGTTFRIYFPATDRELDVAASIAPMPTSLRGSETVLLVEDDAQVRAMSSALLRRSGYTVLDAKDGADAIQRSAQHPESIDLLLTDVVMPRMSGSEVAARIAPSRPEMKVLYVSGYAEGTIVHHGILDPGIAYLEKPITPGSLLRRVREVLDG